MAPRTLHVPWIIDLIRVDDDREIRALGEDRLLDRKFEARGPLLNRILVRRIRTLLSLDGLPLPATASRDDVRRKGGQAALQKRLDAAAGKLTFDGESVASLAAAVRGTGNSVSMGQAVQQVVGSLFAEDYRATEASWAAALFLDKVVHASNPINLLIWKLTGRVQRAKQLLADLVHKDRAGVHATGFAVHNLVRSFELMRGIWARGDSGLSTEAVIARCLVAPPAVLRQATRTGTTASGGIRAGTLIALELEAARSRNPGAEIVFMSGTWSKCPASGWVPALLRVVWETAAQAGGEATRSGT